MSEDRADYEDYDPSVDCDHMDYDLDILTGRASCDMCRYCWYPSNEEVERVLEHQAAYFEQMEREQHWWWRFREKIVSFFQSWRWRRITSVQVRTMDDDEIPF